MSTFPGLKYFQWLRYTVPLINQFQSLVAFQIIFFANTQSELLLFHFSTASHPHHKNFFKKPGFRSSYRKYLKSLEKTWKKSFGSAKLTATSKQTQHFQACICFLCSQKTQILPLLLLHTYFSVRYSKQYPRTKTQKSQQFPDNLI